MSRRNSMAQHNPEMVRVHFGQLAVQYFVAGRAAAIHQLIPVLGNLLHHAVEMALKAALSSRLSLVDLKKLGHNLPRVWATYKTTVSIDVSRFDLVVEDLHRFEELRYPDSVLEHGAPMEFALLREHMAKPEGPSQTPRYTLVLEDIDEFMEFIFEA